MAKELLAAPTPLVVAGERERADTPARRAMRRFLRHRMALVGVAIVLVIGLPVLLAPWVSPYPPNKLQLRSRLQGPSLLHPMGTDELGRDVLSRVLAGGRISLFIGVAAMVVSISIGTLVGGISGYLGGRIDATIMRAVDMAISFPSLFLLLMLTSFLGSSLVIIILVIGVLAWMRVARLVRASFLALKGRDFVTAAWCIGCRPRHVIVRHLLPNALGPVIVAATIDISAAILTESALSYLGLGVQPPQASWGNMLRFAQDQMTSAPWTAIFPGLMIFLVSVAINFIGDGLRDALDPRH